MGRGTHAELGRYRHWRDAVVLLREGVSVRDSHRGWMLIPWELIREVREERAPQDERRRLVLELFDHTTAMLPAPVAESVGGSGGGRSDARFGEALALVTALHREFGTGSAPDQPRDAIPPEYQAELAREVGFRGRSGLWRGGGLCAFATVVGVYCTLLAQAVRVADAQPDQPGPELSAQPEGGYVWVVVMASLTALSVAGVIWQRVRLRRLREGVGRGIRT
ncbi:hypothetical protein KDL01_12255 [Actinospica durhamensis]|uniref:Uncharacterized protein n=1 Tax=Actinospica durhamensis TaxID=1508375 RepID=A0A941IRK9_9ACTN|nr:hypothetical protein [Actinospica durhamensis]MBR7834043.1 hypothetical protein [Actinospica durhamensis]